MISKSLRSFLSKGASSKAGLVSLQSRNSGGGPVKPPMPVTETNFDIVFVGKY
jgi:hypothetical protein